MGFSIEAAVRSAFSWTLVRLFGGAMTLPVPDWQARPYKILFIRDDGIGDLMVSMEIIRAIAGQRDGLVRPVPSHSGSPRRPQVGLVVHP